MSQLSFRFETGSLTSAELALLTPDEIYEMADELLLATLNEDRRLERKPAGIHSKELGEYICMWANTVDGGLIVVGQEDGGAFSGCSRLGQDALNQLEKAGRWHCPDALADNKRLEVHLPSGDLDFVLLIRIYYHPKRVVRDVAGKTFIRAGDSKKEVTNTDEIRALEIEKGQVDIEQEPVDLVYPDDFKFPLIREYVESVKRIKSSVLSIPILRY
jgi:ATP-dependent DNA helicase RecG